MATTSTPNRASDAGPEAVALDFFDFTMDAEEFLSAARRAESDTPRHSGQLLRSRADKRRALVLAAIERLKSSLEVA